MKLILKSTPAGVVLWEGASPVTGREVVAVATHSTSNRKTGNMIQVWILARGMAPASDDEAHRTVCGDCPHGRVPSGDGGCYVLPWQAPRGVWRAYLRGVYGDVLSAIERYRWAEEVRRQGRAIRFGAYGDPGMLPFRVVKGLASIVGAWTGFTRRWRELPLWEGPDIGMRRYLMASVDTREEQAEAEELGWRTFRAAPPVDLDRELLAALPRTAHETICASTQGTTCANCLLCNGMHGATDNRRSIVLPAHGSGKNAWSAETEETDGEASDRGSWSGPRLRQRVRDLCDPSYHPRGKEATS